MFKLPRLVQKKGHNIGSRFTVKMTAALLSIVVMLMAVSCGQSAGTNSEETKNTDANQSANTQKTDDAKSNDAPVDIRFFRVAVTQDPTKDRVLLELQKRTNTKIEFVTAPWDQQGTKVNTMLASGEVIDIMSLDDGQVNFIGHARNGNLLQIDEYLKDTTKYPIESTIAYDSLFKKFLVDGKSYGVPCLNQPGGGWVAGIRKDWLDKVGLPVPKTIDDLYNVFKAFKEQDPDGNGKDDTIATTIAQIFDSWGLMMATHSPAVTFIEDGNGDIEYRYVTEGYKKSLEFLKRLYDDGLVNKDLFTIKDRDLCLNEFSAGKTGIGFSPMWAKTLTDVKNSDPEAQIELLFPVPHDPAYTNGATVNDSGWSWLINVLPKTCRNPEKALELLEYINSDEGRKLTCTGIEGIHYQSYADGVFTGISQEEQNKDWDPKDGEGPTGYPLWWGLTSTINGTIDYSNNKGNLLKAMQECVTFVSAEDKTNNPYYEQRKLITTIMAHEAVPTILESMSQNSGKLQSVRQEYETRLILEPKANFDKIWTEYVEQMKANGLDAVMKEAREWYKNNK